ncbi:hypothetical protein GE061_016579 [Apolygus lucorum]|uniref:JmjC domain-containing protein n=1 Tax=Apolygus lucorum TaxID=248454 RepID=A0A8S9XHR8_APOLU|nr:hypothetical protein GE061_016579 [Apolygus lucorum]
MGKIVKIKVEVLNCNSTEIAVNAVIDISWEECNIGHWTSVPETPKNVYAYASFLKVIICLMKAVKDTDKRSTFLNEAIRAADLGLMLGKGYQRQLTQAASLVASLINQECSVAPVQNSCARKPNESEINENFFSEKPNAVPLDRLHCPSLEEFNAEHFSSRIPVILTGCINHWPALKRWNDVNYLLNTAGPRTVPIEIGSSYTQKDWGMELSSLQDFINKYILQRQTKVGYLAQHQLFDQIPELRNDIVIPDYCCLTDTDESDCDVSINAWFGPANTLTPLHHDPKHNLLCQVVGTKRILLFSPKDSEFLYPHDETLLNNTAQVDPYHPDKAKFPKFEHAVIYYCNLRPGEMLYIPPKWWHHVVSLDVSFSVSFWWD